MRFTNPAQMPDLTQRAAKESFRRRILATATLGCPLTLLLVSLIAYKLHWAKDLAEALLIIAGIIAGAVGLVVMLLVWSSIWYADQRIRVKREKSQAEVDDTEFQDEFE